MMTRIFTLLSTPETAQDREMRECIDALAALEERGPRGAMTAWLTPEQTAELVRA